MDLEKELKAIFAQTFHVPAETISLTTRQEDLKEWDSLGQLLLIMEIETVFGISFHVEEVPQLDSFGKLLENIKKKV